MGTEQDNFIMILVFAQINKIFTYTFIFYGDFLILCQNLSQVINKDVKFQQNVELF